MIPRLEDLTWWQRGLLLLAIVVIITLAILMLQAESEPVQFEVSKFEGRFIALDKEALDEAYKERVRHLFEVWMKDESGQPGRASVGVAQARRAYIHAMGKVEEREKSVGPR